MKSHKLELHESKTDLKISSLVGNKRYFRKRSEKMRLRHVEISIAL